MAVLTYSQLKNLAFDRAGINVTTDAPVSDTEFARFVNEAYSDVWEVSGGTLKKVASATAWSNAQNAAGTVPGLLTDVGEIIALFATSTAPQDISCTKDGTATIVSAALFGTVLAGMAVSGTGITTGTYVLSKTNSSTLILSETATAGTHTLTFSPVGGTGDVPLDKVDPERIHHMRGIQGFGTYATPKLYAATRLATTTPGNVGKLQLDYWPSVTGFYFPMHYTGQFTEIDSATVTTPDVNDLESRDIGLLTAARLAPLVDRSELVPPILADISERTAKALERKISAMLHARQDDAAARRQG